MNPGERLPKASVFMTTADGTWVVTETPSEVHGLVQAARGTLDSMIQLTLAVPGEWNGKPVYVDAAHITAVSPPMDVGQDD